VTHVFEGLPDKRTSLVGLTDEGDEAWLIRGIAGKLYRCPGCHGEVDIGTDHVIVHYVRRLGGTDHHHWHRRCAEEVLLGELRSVRRVNASSSSQGRIAERGRRPAGKRRRRR
jgi:hypothetical protein